jgi:hypothetical protein
MKFRYLLFSLCLITAIIIIGCDKADQKKNPKKKATSSIVGSWELRVLHGGMIPRPEGPNYPPGNGDKWKFTDSLYEHYEKGQLASHGKYSLIKDTCPATGTYMDAFVVQEDYPHRIFFEFSKDTLVMYNGIIAADGTITKYVSLAE